MVAGEKVVRLETLDPPQLQDIRNQFESQIQSLQAKVSALRTASARFETSRKTLEVLVPANDGKTILAPLTTSLYVPGVLKTEGRVLIDIGTGYHVEKTNEDAKEYFNKKIAMLVNKTAEADGSILEKKKVLEQIDALQAQKIHQAPIPLKQ